MISNSFNDSGELKIGRYVEGTRSLVLTSIEAIEFGALLRPSLIRESHLNKFI